MRLVLAALGRPITIVVALISLALVAFLAIERMPVDIFPKVGENAIYVAQLSGVNYFSRSATIISPDQRQLQP
jgi:multidrug efflux pump subunit AcrB